MAAPPYVGEIRQFAGNFAPVGWNFCDGSLQSIAENETLFNLIGTTYGGDGQTTFALPDLRGRFPIHQGTGGGATYVIGQLSGTETVTLITSQMPAHSHAPAASASAVNATDSPANNFWADSTGKPYAVASPVPTLVMNTGGVLNTGSSQPHDNMMPFLTISYIISFFGIFPSQ
jgi:microcystin-dependent protein